MFLGNLPHKNSHKVLCEEISLHLYDGKAKTFKCRNYQSSCLFLVHKFVWMLKDLIQRDRMGFLADTGNVGGSSPTSVEVPQ